MIYRATIASAAGLYLVALAIAGSLVCASVFSPTARIPFAVAGIAIVAWIVAVRIRYFVQVSGEELRARSLVRESHVKWQDIVMVRPASQRGFWSSRFLGPLVLEFVSLDSTTRINFKLFPAECSRDVLQHVPPGARL